MKVRGHNFDKQLKTTKSYGFYKSYFKMKKHWKGQEN